MVIIFCFVVGCIAYLVLLRIQNYHNKRTFVEMRTDTIKDQSNQMDQTAQNPVTDPFKTEKRPDSDATNNNNSGWKCACEGGGIFLPPSLMRNLGGPGAALRLGAGSCYHKQI
jgi:hypothetical protein